MDKAPDAFRTISEVADELDVPQHVLRFWETRFSQIRPMKRGGGRRYYRPDDLDLLRGIRHLLYGEGYTIRGVQRILRDQGVKFVQTVWQAGAAQPPRVPADDVEIDDEAAAEPQTTGASRGLFGLLSPRREADQESDEAEAADDAEEGDKPDEAVEAPPAAAPRREPPPLAAERPSAPQRIEPSFAPPPSPPPIADPAPPPAPAAVALSREDLRKLQASLHELSECRRLIDQVMDDQNP